MPLNLSNNPKIAILVDLKKNSVQVQKPYPLNGFNLWTKLKINGDRQR